MNTTNRLYRSRDERMIAGGAAGIAKYLDVDPTLVRLAWIVLSLFGGVPGLLIYLLCWLIIPTQPRSDDLFAHT